MRNGKETKNDTARTAIIETECCLKTFVDILVVDLFNGAKKLLVKFKNNNAWYF